MTAKDFAEEVYENHKDEYTKDSWYVPPSDAQYCLDILTRHFLGEDYYITDPVCTAQGNTIEVYDILVMYPIPKHISFKEKIKRLKRLLQQKRKSKKKKEL
jgi:hypothetical protein